jgi:hypothetical protein
LVSAVAVLSEAGSIAAEEAGKHIGETNTVCGKVVSAHFAEREKGAPTFLNLDKAGQPPLFTIVIWMENRGQFEQPPEQMFLRKRVCVTGRITDFEGVPQIVVTKSAQIKVVSH